MPTICTCTKAHEVKRIVLTGGPGAGKTAVLDLVKQSFCRHVVVLQESAGVIFGGGFPRRMDAVSAQSAQRAIYYVQRELENAAEFFNPAIALCDRGTVDGAAYWLGDTDLWRAVETTHSHELSRYAAVIHLRVPSVESGYNHRNPLRLETADEAAQIDARIASLWSLHPNRFSIEPQESFIKKASLVLEILEQQVPDCCRSHFRLSRRA
ncbi:MAG TPA: ATP-binding protein [Gemmatimonadaceae bacterium]|nr:ATP-binding protein [Gemmatimonadaceae bacterium]